MKALFRNSLLAALFLTLLSFGGSAFAGQQINDWVTILGSPGPVFLELYDTYNTSWYLNNSWLGDGSLSVYNSGKYPFVIEKDSPTNLLYLDSYGLIGINTNNPVTTLDINDDRPAIRLYDTASGSQCWWSLSTNKFFLDGDINPIFEIDTRAPRSLVIDADGTVRMPFSGSNTTGDGTTLKLTLHAYNYELTKASDVGFGMENMRKGFTWVFRTYEPAEGFTASKLGTGGTEFLVRNTTNDYRNASLHMGNGAVCNASGQWINASSREYKENIKTLTTDKALEALASIKPVTYNFKRDEEKDLNVGFIAEDVPDLVATADRKGLNSLEIVAMLTKVVQDQQDQIDELSKLVKELQKEKVASKNTNSL